jgi:hypothetical protein
MSLVLAAIFGALATAVLGPLMVASVEAKRHDRQVEQRDEDLEEWIVSRHRRFVQRLAEVTQQATEAGLAQGGGAIASGHAKVRTLLLYELRDELRQARAFVLTIAVEERWTHRLARWLKRQPFPELATPTRAERLIDYWSEGTARNALTWSIDDILRELPQRATSRAIEV